MFWNCRTHIRCSGIARESCPGQVFYLSEPDGINTVVRRFRELTGSVESEFFQGDKNVFRARSSSLTTADKFTSGLSGHTAELRFARESTPED